jgi:hypothetical protein
MTLTAPRPTATPTPTEHPLIVERYPYRLELVRLPPGYYAETIRLDHPLRLMEWMGEPYPCETDARLDARSHCTGLSGPLPLSAASFSHRELLGLAEALERGGRRREAAKVRDVMALLRERVEGVGV